MVRDVEEGDAALLQAGDALEQPGHLARLELCGRLVEDDEAGALQQGARDLDDLALLDREVLGIGIDVDLEAPVLEHAARLAPERSPRRSSRRPSAAR